MLAAPPQENRFCHIDFDIKSHEEFLPGDSIRQKFATDSPNQPGKSPKMSKNNMKGKKGQPQGKSITLSESELPDTPIRPDGVTHHVKFFLEVGLIHEQWHCSANQVLIGCR